jgi:hypothetical protein
MEVTTMRLFKILFTVACGCLLMGTASASVPAVGFDLAHAQGHNFYYTNFFVNQVLGNVFTVVGTHDITVTDLGAFDMNPDNEPYWDLPVYAQPGFNFNHGVAIFNRANMAVLGQVMLPVGTGAPIRDEGFRYMPLENPVTLHVGGTYVIAAWWSADSIDQPDMETFYLMGTAPDQIPSTVTVNESIQIVDGCFNPNAGDGSSVPAPFIFNMFWGLYAGGANFLIDQPVTVESQTWGGVKSLFQ